MDIMILHRSPLRCCPEALVPLASEHADPVDSGDGDADRHHLQGMLAAIHHRREIVVRMTEDIGAR
jgi:hypothetical protein